MSRAAMEARRAGTETGEVQEAQHGEGQIQRQKGECESDRTEVRGPLWDRSGLWVGRETGEGEEAVAFRWWGRDGWSEKASPGRCRIVGSSGVSTSSGSVGRRESGTGDREASGVAGGDGGKEGRKRR